MLTDPAKDHPFRQDWHQIQVNLLSHKWERLHGFPRENLVYEQQVHEKALNKTNASKYL